MDSRARQRVAQFTRAVLWHRRLLAAGLGAGAVALAIHAADAEPETVPLVVAARDLPGGGVLREADLVTTDALPAAVPAGMVTDIDSALGRLLAGPVRRGEAITDVRLVGPSLLEGWGDGLLAVPVRIADSGAVTIARPGELIDLIAAPVDGQGEAGPIAIGVPVLAIPAQTEGGLHADGALIIVAVNPAQAADLAEAAVSARISLAIH